MPFEEPISHWTPVRTIGANRPSNWLVICDHASNHVPEFVAGGDLGIAPEDMSRHIAFDPGSAGVTMALAERLNAPAILSDFSRLVIDPNRGEDDPTLLMKLYDGTIIPANRYADEAEVKRRMDLCYRPYHAAVENAVGRQSDTAIVSVHSFTPQLRGRPPRPWEVGILHAGDVRLSQPLIQLLAKEGLNVGENVPYGGSLKGDTIDRHAIQQGRQNTLIEIRNDLIQTPEQQQSWADRFARLLPLALEQANA